MNFNDYNFDFLMDRSRFRLRKKPNEPLYIKQYISKLYDYVQKIKDNNPDISLEKLQEIFNKDYIEILDTIFNNSYTLDYSMAYESCLYLSNNKDMFYKLLKEYNDNPKDIPDEYSTDFNSNLKYFISQLKTDYDKFLNSDDFKTPQLIKLRDKLLDTSITNTEKNKICNHILSQLSFSTKQHLKKFIDCTKNGEVAYLKYELKNVEEDLQENLIQSISSIGKQLEKLGFLETYPKFQENSYKNLLGIYNFAHPINSSKNNTGLIQLANPSYLSGLSLDTLLALNNFWCNRFIKEADTYFESIYSMEQLDLLPDMLYGSFNINQVSEDDLKNIFLKMNFFYQPMRSYWEYASQPSSDKVEKYQLKDKNYYFLSNNELIESMEKNTGDQYNEYFKKLLPNSDLKNDLDLYWKLFTPIVNGYSFKDSSILSTLALSESLNLSSNYGIVLDENTLYNTSPNMPLNFWIDFKGLNFPLREHIPANTLRNFLLQYKGDCMVPLYMDSEAFSGIPSHILFPFNKQQISFIKSEKKDNFEKYSGNIKALRFLKHSAFLINPKSLKKNSEKLYFNLEDYQLYKNDENCKYIKIDHRPFDNNEVPSF